MSHLNRPFRSGTEPEPHRGHRVCLPSRQLILALAMLLALHVMARASEEPPLERVAFGSCNHQNRPQPLWDAILDFKPDLWIWLGDNIYGDSERLDVLAAKWAKQKAQPGYSKLLATCMVQGVWDDHDFGVNDGGKNYPQRTGSQRLFLDFLDAPPDDPRRTRDGIYGTETYGPPGRQTRLILLDVRFHRDPPGRDADILGHDQWRWLEGVLQESTAQIHLIASGSQILPQEHRFEKWADYPRSRERLLGLLSKHRPASPILLSGDRHHAEISATNIGAGRVIEVTSSSMTHSITKNLNEPNALRLGGLVTVNNFGTATIHWEARSILLAIRDGTGKALLSEQVAF